MYLYENLEKHFTKPKRVSPFYDSKRIPRRLKKKVKRYCLGMWNKLTNGQRLWYYLEKHNKWYRIFLIKQMCLE